MMIGTGFVYERGGKSKSLWRQWPNIQWLYGVGPGLQNQSFTAPLVMRTWALRVGETLHSFCGTAPEHYYISHVRRDGSQNLPENLYILRNIWQLTAIWMICQPLFFLDLKLWWCLSDLAITMNFLYWFSQTAPFLPPGTLLLLDQLLGLFKLLHGLSAPVPLTPAPALFKLSPISLGC